MPRLNMDVPTAIELQAISRRRTADLVIMESEFLRASWEPSDCSVLDHPSGRFQIYSHFGGRLVALCDSEETAEIVIMRAKLGGALACLRKPEPDPWKREFRESWFEPTIRDIRDELSRLGATVDGTPETDGSDLRMAATPEAALVRQLLERHGCVRLLAGQDRIEVMGKVGDDFQTVDGAAGMALEDAHCLVRRFFSDRFLEEDLDDEPEEEGRRGRAWLRLGPEEVAAIELIIWPGRSWQIDLGRQFG